MLSLAAFLILQADPFLKRESYKEVLNMHLMCYMHEKSLTLCYSIQDNNQLQHRRKYYTVDVLVINCDPAK